MTCFTVDSPTDRLDSNLFRLERFQTRATEPLAELSCDGSQRWTVPPF